MKKINRISSTAYTISLMRKIGLSKKEILLPHAPILVSLRLWLKRLLIPSKIKKTSELIAERYQALNGALEKLIEKYNGQIIVLELACGFSSRGFDLVAENKVFWYCDSDIDRGIVSKKQKIVAKLSTKENYEIICLDALSENLTSTLRYFDKLFPRKPLIIICEGLIGYLNEEQRKILLNKILSTKIRTNAPIYFLCPLKISSKKQTREKQSLKKKIVKHLIKTINIFSLAPIDHYNTDFVPNPKKALAYFYAAGFAEVSILNHTEKFFVIACKNNPDAP